MAINTIPTMLKKVEVRYELNPDVCDVLGDTARVRFPDGSGQILKSYRHDPEGLARILREWLEAHLEAERQRQAEGDVDDGAISTN